MAETTDSKAAHPTDAEVVAWLDENCEHGWSCARFGLAWHAYSLRYAYAPASLDGYSECGTTQAEARRALARRMGMLAAVPGSFSPGPSEACDLICRMRNLGMVTQEEAEALLSGKEPTRRATKWWEPLAESSEAKPKIIACGPRCKDCVGTPETCAYLSQGATAELFDGCLDFSPKPRPVCPLPDEGRWDWTRKPTQGFEALVAQHGECRLAAAGPTDGQPWWDWDVYEDGRRLAQGVTKTRRGAMRAAERAARKAWSVRNG